MKTAIELAKKMYKEPEVNWLPALEEINLHIIFRPIYKEKFDFATPNRIVAFIILSYDNDSSWIDTRKDRLVNKISILEGIDANPNDKIFKDIINYENDKVQEVILKYLINQTDSRWQEIISLLDYSNKMILYCNKKVEEKNQVDVKYSEEGKPTNVYEYLDPIEVSKINKEKGDLLMKAIEARKTAEELLKQLENDFQKVDHATQVDFNFTFSDVKKYDVLSWEQRVRKRKQLLS